MIPAVVAVAVAIHFAAMGHDGGALGRGLGVAACALAFAGALGCGSNGGSGSGVADGGHDAHDAARDVARDASDGGACVIPGATDAGPPSPDPVLFASVARSCAYSCPLSPSCTEQTTPYACQNLAAWECMPHAPSCGAWDGSYPPVVAGKCTASAPASDSAKYAGVDPADPTTRILPDGRRMQPAGHAWIFSESDLQGGLTTGIIAIPGTSYVVTVDDGTDDHAVRLIDTTKVGSGSTPVVSYVKYANPSTLNSGLAFRAPDLVLVTTDNGNIQALTLDTGAGTIANDPTRSLTLPAPLDGTATFYASGVAVSPDGTRAVVTGVTDPRLLVFDVGAGSSTYGTLLGQVNLGQAETFAVAFDPHDALGTTAYVSMWAGRQVLEVDVSTPSAPALGRSFATAKDPEGMTFLDARFLVVANDLGDSLSIVDRMAGTVSSVSVLASDGYPGVEPIGVAYDATSKRLYVPLAGANAVAAYAVDLTTTPPTLAPSGRLPTSWWPSGVVVLGDGSLAVASMQGDGSGPDPMYFDIGSGAIGDLMRGGIQVIPTPSASDLTSGDAKVAAMNDVAGLAGAPAVTCPAGASDFPLPPTNTAGASPVIQHVFLFIRENKSFDGIFGDLPGVNGEPSYTLKTAAGEMDVIWANYRTLGRTFSIADNFYSDAVYSTQGHMWDTFGRSCDFSERTWAMAGDGRNARAIPGSGTIDVGQPAEGSLFDWLDANGVDYDILGEIVGLPRQPSATHPPIDTGYPGGAFQDIFYNDDEKACHIAGRARVTCDFGSFVYATLPNDHTRGVDPSHPPPETYCAVNDDATGMAVDAISHSPLWASSLIFITEDDPSQGGEHVDSHRTPLIVLSPWVKRGYVSKTHFDVPSLHKMLAHVFGKPYPNTVVAHAALPLDLFTSTPDYTPYVYSPRTFPLSCGAAITKAERRLTSSWDFDDVDEQPGLDRQVMRWMRGQQLESLTPAMERAVESRWDKRLAWPRPRQSQPGAVRAPESPARDDDGDDD